MHVVWFAEIKWDYLRTRKQQLILRRPPDVDVLFLEPYVRGRSNAYRLRETDGIRVATVPFIKNVPAGPARLALEFPPARWLVDREAARRVRALLHAARVDSAGATFVISNVYAVRVATAFARGALVYDCNDAHSAFPGMPGWTRDYQERTCRVADAVVATSEVLREDVVRMRGSDAGVRLLGNGVDYARFASARTRSATDRAVVGYLGAIAPWLDFDLIERLARTHPEWQVVLIGPVMGGVEDRLSRLTALDNVVARPAVAYEDVPAALSGFTVGMIPFRRNELTRGVNPNKMYEYLACGVPVVATAFSPEVSRFPEVVAAVDDQVAFGDACAGFIRASLDPGAGERLRAAADEVARAHDWDAIATAFWKDIRGAAAVST